MTCGLPAFQFVWFSNSIHSGIPALGMTLQDFLESHWHLHNSIQSHCKFVRPVAAINIIIYTIPHNGNLRLLTAIAGCLEPQQKLVFIFKMNDCGESINQILLLSAALLLYSVFSFVCLKHKHGQAAAVRSEVEDIPMWGAVRGEKVVNHFLISDKIPP